MLIDSVACNLVHRWIMIYGTLKVNLILFHEQIFDIFLQVYKTFHRLF